ncbi:MAG: nucleotidyltransferase domain-containing protein [Candidatus Bathyarchaeota archaeon]|nr:nucleotidyltransferase domain-containing protein [Candidatus Bathyarchaeota archaeon]
MALNQSIKAREGDFIETVEGLIFDVKGLVHPPDRVIAYLRYLESPEGDRVRGSKRYMKVYSLSDRDAILRRNYPHYVYYDDVFGEWLEGALKSLITVHYQPVKKALSLVKRRDLSAIEAQAVRFIQELRDYAGIHSSSIGVSGSILVGLYDSSSDIDVVVYGRRESVAAYSGLKALLGERRNGFSPYGLDDLKKLYDFRFTDTRIPFNEFCKVELRKAFQGKFLGRDFFVRFVPDWDEVYERYGDRVYRSVGYARVKALVEDDSEALFTPCIYRVSEVKLLEGECDTRMLREIVSFRGRFCDHARRGEYVIAQGKVEKVIEKTGCEYYRMILGAKPSDFMIVKDTLQ